MFYKLFLLILISCILIHAEYDKPCNKVGTYGENGDSHVVVDDLAKQITCYEQMFKDMEVNQASAIEKMLSGID